MSEPTLRPIDTLLNPLPVRPDELHAVGTLDGQPWHSSKHIAVAGPPPSDGTAERTGYDFGKWIARRQWIAIEPDGWWRDHENDDDPDRGVIVRFAPELVKGGFCRNFLNGRFFRYAVRHGAVSWEMRKDGAIVVARDAKGKPVAMIACMQLVKGSLPE